MPSFRLRLNYGISRRMNYVHSASICEPLGSNPRPPISQSLSHFQWKKPCLWLGRRDTSAYFAHYGIWPHTPPPPPDTNPFDILTNAKGSHPESRHLSRTCHSTSGKTLPVAGAEGFEPPNAGTKTRCLTTWPRPTFLSLSNYFY